MYLKQWQLLKDRAHPHDSNTHSHHIVHEVVGRKVVVYPKKETPDDRSPQARGDQFEPWTFDIGPDETFRAGTVHRCPVEFTTFGLQGSAFTDGGVPLAFLDATSALSLISPK